MMQDPLIDEVRAIRRRIVADAGNDVATLCEQLRKVEGEYQQRIGVFAQVPREIGEELFPEMNTPIPDPLMDEVHAIRDDLARRRRPA